MEADHAAHASDTAVTTAEEVPVEPDTQAKQELSRTDSREHLASDNEPPDTATPSLQPDAEAADSSAAVHHAAPHTDDDLRAEAAPSEWVMGREHRPDTAEEHAPMQSGVAKAIHCMTLALMQMYIWAGGDQGT